MQNLDFLICPVLYLWRALAFSPQRHFPGASLRTAPGQGESPADTKGSRSPKRHFPQCLGPCTAPRGVRLFLLRTGCGFIAGSPAHPQSPGERGCSAGVCKPYVAGLCLPALCVVRRTQSPVAGQAAARCARSPRAESQRGQALPGWCWGYLGILLPLAWGEDFLPAVASSTVVFPLRWGTSWLLCYGHLSLRAGMLQFH